MINKMITAVVGALMSLSCFAQDTNPLWMRYPAISPDGSTIVFSFKGDLYTIATKGGPATALTTNPAYDFNPVWSADSKTIAFASDRFGNMDVFIVPTEGGTPKRLTTSPSEDIPFTFSPDGKQVIFGATIQDPANSAMFPARYLPELYSVALDQNRPVQLLAVSAENVMYADNGKMLLYNDIKGQENDWRKHHTSSVTRDLWSHTFATNQYKKLTQNPAEDRQPIAVGENVFFLSERSGTMNVWSFPLNAPEKTTQVTSFEKNPVRFLSATNNGILCYGYRGEIYTQQPGGTPSKVGVTIATDASENDIEALKLSNGASEAAVSSDGKEIALIIRGEVFVTSSDYATTKRITETAEQERSVSFSPDGKTLVYASERNGSWNIYLAKRERTGEPNFATATLITEEPLLETKEETFFPKFSPDGKEVAFLESRTKLKVINLASKKVREITDGSKTFSYSDGDVDYNWSPDSKWFAISYNDKMRHPHTDIGIVSAEGGKAAINITESGYSETNPSWVMKGDAIIWLSEREGMVSQAGWGAQRDVYAFFINQKAFDRFMLSKEDYDLLKDQEKKDTDAKKKDAAKDDSTKGTKKTEPLNIDFSSTEDRIVRLTINSSDISDAILSNDGEKLFYLTKFEGGYDLWATDIRKKETKVMVKLNGRGGSLALDKEGKNLFVLSGNSSSKIEISSEKKTAISYSADMTINHPKEMDYMFNHIGRQVEEKFFRIDLQGVDWKYYKNEYRKFLPYINNNYDFAEMLSEMLGELNCSHSGSGYRANDPSGDKIASLGLIYDLNYRGAGMRVAEVLAKGPFKKAESKITAGCIVEKINGLSIAEGQDLSPLLNRKNGQKTLISIRDPKTGSQWDEVIEPISTAQESELLYQRWVNNRKHEVDSLSKGRLGYVHIRGMNEPSYRTTYSDVFGKYNNREGIVIDTRYNGGGHLHEDIEVLFSGKKYLDQVPRGQKIGEQPRKRWKKPSIMLISESNYSNAHGTPWVYQKMGIGKLVGMPVPGTMSSVWWETLQDPTLYFGIPVVGYIDDNGKFLENQQLEPDFKVANDPSVIVSGKDQQIVKAVEELLRQIDQKKK
ncbi:S41 family peptidase [Williamwhitmania taraxaci]|uniref:Tricorn protease homolog n=1 Tax=Williamwhitmania taraxaci TaxID=1640674 RepID=A0A1G6RC43_9BACT|nr:C-terminal processing protease CtpA/Prc, contains a PDZ domain [Williamwhitmania taraxaci]